MQRRRRGGLKPEESEVEGFTRHIDCAGICTHQHVVDCDERVVLGGCFAGGQDAEQHVEIEVCRDLDVVGEAQAECVRSPAQIQGQVFRGSEPEFDIEGDLVGVS